MSTQTDVNLRAYDERVSQLCSAVGVFLDTHDAWKGADERRRPRPDDVYWASFEEMLTLTAIGAIPESCRELIRKVNNIEEEKALFDEGSSSMPGGRFWRAVDQLRYEQQNASEGTKRNWSMDYTVRQLHDQDVGHSQIAEMFGITIAQVAQEIAEPGSVIDSKTFVHPFERQTKDRDSEAASRFVELDADERRLQSENESFMNREADESWWDLWIQGVEVSQAAAMKRVGQAEAENAYQRINNDWELIEGRPKRRDHPLAPSLAPEPSVRSTSTLPVEPRAAPHAPAPSVDLELISDNELLEAARQRGLVFDVEGEPDPDAQYEAAEDTGVFPQDYDELKAMAKEHGVDTRGNPKAETLRARIAKAMIEEERGSSTGPSLPTPGDVTEDEAPEPTENEKQEEASTEQ